MGWREVVVAVCCQGWRPFTVAQMKGSVDWRL